MSIVFNGQTVPLAGETPLGEWLVARGYEGETFVILLNGEPFPPGKWRLLTIKPGDRLDVLHFVGGG